MKLILGVDVSKDYLDVAYRHKKGYQTKRYAHNSAKSAKKIAADFKDHELHVVMEVTGTYGMKLAQGFYEMGIAVSMVNPLCIKRFGQMKLRRAKTDAYDAELIAEYGETQELRLWSPKPEAQEQLLQVVRALDDLQVIRTELRNRQEAASQLIVREANCEAVFKSLLTNVEASIAALKQRLKRLLESHYSEEKHLLESVPGIGIMTIGNLIALCGRFENFEKASQVVAFAGLNPSPYQSGTSVRGRGGISKRGHASLRRMLYMGAFSALKYIQPCRELYLRLIERGKPSRVARVAVAHKLLRQAFGVLKQRRAFQADFVKS